VLDNQQHRAGLGGITVAAAYHDGRDVFPHNPVRKVRFLESGAVFCEPGPALRGVRLQPQVREAAHVLSGLVDAQGGEVSLCVRGPSSFTTPRSPKPTPDCAPENAFGGSQPHRPVSSAPGRARICARPRD
jgi:hypothetical protein